MRCLFLNKLVKRTFLDTDSAAVEYRLIEYGKESNVMIENLSDWEIKPRKKIIGKEI